MWWSNMAYGTKISVANVARTCLSKIYFIDIDLLRAALTKYMYLPFLHFLHTAMTDTDFTLCLVELRYNTLITMAP